MLTEEEKWRFDLHGDLVLAQAVAPVDVLRVVLALTGNCPQPLGSAHARNTRDSDALALHGGVSGGLHDPASDDQAADGRCFATLLNAGVPRVDVPPGTGFVCVPRSHVSTFRGPRAWASTTARRRSSTSTSPCRPATSSSSPRLCATARDGELGEG